MRSILNSAAVALSLLTVSNAQAFHKHYGYTTGASFSYAPASVAAYSFAPAASFYAPASFGVPAASFVPASFAVPAASFTPSFSAYPLPPAAFAPGGSASMMTVGSLLSILDVLDRITAWADKRRPESTDLGRKVDDLSREVEKINKTLATLKPFSGDLNEEMKKISTELQTLRANTKELSDRVKRLKDKVKP